MENNNNTKAKNLHTDSLDAAITTVAHPFETLEDKITCVTNKWNSTDGVYKDKVKAWKEWFSAYYTNPKVFNHYGLTVDIPKA